MADWGENPVKKVELTKGEYTKLLEKVLEVGTARNREMSGKISEEDFLCGAMSTMEALGIKCPMWPLAIQFGEKLLVKIH